MEIVDFEETDLELDCCIVIIEICRVGGSNCQLYCLNAVMEQNRYQQLFVTVHLLSRGRYEYYSRD